MKEFIEKNGRIYYNLRYWNEHIKTSLNSRALCDNDNNEKYMVFLVEVPYKKEAANYEQFYKTLIRELKKFVLTYVEKYDDYFEEYTYMNLVEVASDIFDDSFSLNYFFDASKKEKMAYDYGIVNYILKDIYTPKWREYWS